MNLSDFEETSDQDNENAGASNDDYQDKQPKEKHKKTNSELLNNMFQNFGQNHI